ncbi:MAG: geranylgeranylglycerol-phosphate geranylgeranyltransferase [Candidatus Methanoperedens sp.]|nr:geranylgeranylglycerol-phosphate geranylgeranyltransferase [Candidatus Methanoperedens sp.]
MKVILELIRYKNCAMAGLAAVIGAAIAYSATPGDPVWMGFIFITVFIITGAGNALNDYFDANIDAINRPGRPIPSGRISKESAYNLSISMFFLGLIVSFFIGSNGIPRLIAGFNAILLLYYAKSLKRKVVVGNLTVSYLTGSTFLFGGAAYGGKGIQVTLILFFLSMLATFAREIVKTIEDIEGDRLDGASTIPIKIGETKATYIACAFGVLAVLLSPLPYLLDFFNEYYLIVVGVADLVFLYAMVRILRKDPAASSKYFKVAMFLAMLAFIAGSILNSI